MLSIAPSQKNGASNLHVDGLNAEVYEWINKDCTYMSVDILQILRGI